MKKKLDVIFSGNLSTTPRVRRFLEVGLENGWEFRLFYLKRSPKWNALDEELFSTFSKMEISTISIFKRFSIGRVLMKIGSLLNKVPESFALRVLYGWKSGGKNIPVSLFSAGAFPLVSELKNTVHLDIEDFYDGETTPYTANNAVICKFRERAKQAPVISFSSPNFMGETTRSLGELVPNFSSNWTVVNKPISKTGKPLKIVWFGQVVGPDRGLEQVISWVGNRNEMELFLYGELREEMADCIHPFQNIYHSGVVSESDLNAQLDTFDVGLISDLGANWNNEILWSNKIAAYFQKGIPILWSNTLGNQSFNEYFGVVGASYSDQESFGSAIRKVLAEIEILSQKAIERAESFNLRSNSFHKTFFQIEKYINSLSTLGPE